MTRRWVDWAVATIGADFDRSADTHLVRLDLPGWREAGIDLYLKDESTHPTGSLKHRLARSLFLYALCNGAIREGMTLVEASSGSTAISEAYFARLLGLPFIAVMPASTSPEKIAQIEFYGGRCHLVAVASEVYAASETLARDTGGYYMDQFTYAERATDWRGNNNIAESIFQQMRRERHPVPEWIVVGAGTGGTSATLGRYVRYQQHPTRIAVVDPEGSVFADFHSDGDTTRIASGSRIEGIGRPRVEASFLPGIVDTMLRVRDAESIAGMRVLSQHLGRRVGPSTGTNFIGVAKVARELMASGQSGSIVTLICDDGQRYAKTYYAPEWVERWVPANALAAAEGELAAQLRVGS
jgi:cysteine synthase